MISPGPAIGSAGVHGEADAKAPRVMHVITGLAHGGAEMLLVRMLEALGDQRAGHSVVSLRPRWFLADHIEELGVPVHALGMSGLPTPAKVFRLGRFLRRSEADVIQTWMLHSNVLAGLAARAVGRSPVVWGIHVTDTSRSIQGTKAVLMQRLEALCSWFVPARIVACSESAHEVMDRLHYRHGRIVTILNGFDLGTFKPDPAARAEVRSELGISPDTVVVGHTARFHPMKDHATLLAAAGKVLDQVSDVRFVLIGADVTADNPELRQLAAPLGDRVLLLGRREDIPRLLNGFDLAVQSSANGEALPLVIGEAMATGLPVVSTRCGDSEQLISDTGATAPVRDPAALAEALMRLIALEPEQRGELGERARLRISERYSMTRMVEQYQALWAEVAGGAPVSAVGPGA